MKRRRLSALEVDFRLHKTETMKKVTWFEAKIKHHWGTSTSPADFIAVAGDKQLDIYLIDCARYRAKSK